MKNSELLEQATIMKKLYGAFETLAMSLPDNSEFFNSNPNFHIYDTYLTYINVACL